VAFTRALCGHCGSSTRLLALALPPDHEVREEDGRTASNEIDAPDTDPWQCARGNAFLFYVELLPDAVKQRLGRLSGFFRKAHSKVTLTCYWANHCEQCGVLFDDHELHCELDGAFMPSSGVAAAKIELRHVHERFEVVAAGYAFEPEFFSFMPKA
jgi:hypothetical protein